MVLALLGVASAADGAALRDAWEGHRATLDAHAVYPLRFDDAFWSAVAGGDVGRRRDAVDGVDRVIGVVLVPTSRDRTWVAIQDAHAGTVDGFLDESLPSSTFDRRVAWQRIELPWPLVARQWVIEVTNNKALRDATSGAVWERTWTLSTERPTDHASDNAVWLPTNEGGWFLVEAGGGTLVGYHVRTSVGGVVPEEVAVRWSYGTLKSLLDGIRTRAVTWVPDHYGDGHAPVLRPDQTPVAPKAP